MTPADRRRLEHIFEQIDKIERYTLPGRVAFDTDEKTQDAVLHCLTVIGETAGALSEGTYRRLLSLPPKSPRGQRNIIVHEYWRIDRDIIWETLTRDLPKLRNDVSQLLG